MSDFYLIQGEQFEDHRGKLTFANTFDMQDVKRFYILHHHDAKVIRAWQGHAKESKWLSCLQGCFVINLVKPLNVLQPTGFEQPELIKLKADENKILCIPGGYYTGIKAATTPSSLLIFSDFTLEDSKQDDFRKETNFWTFKTGDQ